MYRPLGKKTAAKEEGWDEHSGLNEHHQHGCKGPCLLLSTKGSQRVPKSLLQIWTKLLASPGCSSFWTIPYLSGSLAIEAQASDIRKNIKINSKKSQGILHWSLSVFSSPWHLQTTQHVARSWFL